MIQGVIFDMDGVLVDSEEFICQAAIKMFAEKRVTVAAADFLPFVGTGEDRYLGGVAEQYGVPLNLATDKERTYALYGELVVGNLSALPGVRTFLDKCQARQLKRALATSADKTKMLTNLREIDLPPTAFDAVVNGLDIRNKKPDPEIFLLAAKRLGIAAAACLVVEDAVTGVAAAKAAGMKCLGLTTSFSAEELAAADWTAPNLATAPEAVLGW